MQIVREAGGVCVADEVQTGFGRTGSHYWGFQSQVGAPESALLVCAEASAHLPCFVPPVVAFPSRSGNFGTLSEPEALHAVPALGIQRSALVH